MKDPLVQTVLHFLKEHWNGRQPLLLAFSGGPDSLALYYLLLECKKVLPFTFAAAHVDHGWRAESSEEARQLELLSSQHGIPFYSTRLDHDPASANMEAIARQKRLDFFKELSQKHNFQATLLAHHQDDSAETVLKKLFEGSSLSSCIGIAEIALLDGLSLWRPLLSLNKKSLLSWLEHLSHNPFHDLTNLDQKFLRARMRITLIPHLEELFGKGMVKTLSNIGSEAQELHHFLMQHLAHILETIQTTENGCFVDLSKYPHLTLFEIKFILRYAFQKEGCFVSKEILADAAQKLQDQSPKKEFIMKTLKLEANKGRLSVEFSNRLKKKQWCNII